MCDDYPFPSVDSRLRHSDDKILFRDAVDEKEFRAYCHSHQCPSPGTPLGYHPYCRDEWYKLGQIKLADPEPTAWQPMQTAPKDGTEVLLAVESRAGIRGRCLVGHWMPGGHCIEDHPPIDEGWYFWTGRMFDKEAKPTHWAPLPNLDSIAIKPPENGIETPIDELGTICENGPIEPT